MGITMPEGLPAALESLLQRRYSGDAKLASAARSAFLKETQGLRLDAGQARALLDFATDPALPPPPTRWEDAAADALNLLWTAPSEVKAGLVARVCELYGGAREALRLSLLTQLAATDTDDAAAAVVVLVTKHGFPPRTYARLFHELYGHLDRADVLFPALFEHAGISQLESGNVLLAALSKQKLSPTALRALAPSIVRSLDEAVAGATARAQPEGIAWRFDEAYWPFRSRAGFYADLAGFLARVEVEAVLRRALASVDPWIAMFAAASLLRLGAEVDGPQLERLASSHEVRGILFEQLVRLGQPQRYPPAWATLDAFAAADMVQWLKYPAELGREPDVLERMAVFEAHHEGRTLVLYVWRFSGHGGKLCAGVSGPYEKEGPPGPVRGASTFSKFAAWDADTADGHASAVLKTLAQWRKRDA